MLQRFVTLTLLLAVTGVARLLWRVEFTWVGTLPPGDPWGHLRIVAILNHTSLYEPIFAGGAPYRFLRRMAEHGVIPVAQKTLSRPIVGRFFRQLAPHVVALSRQRDHTWCEVLASVDDPKKLVALLPEGRMKRASGLDSEGRPMTVRAGIADLILSVPEGRMLLAYSEGLHHVQVPGQRLPRVFTTVRMRLETLDIAAYRRELLERAGERGFHAAVIEDLTRRRDLYCAPTGWQPASP
jgi:hypothetical protein